MINKMKYGAVGALVGAGIGLVLMFIFPSLLQRNLEINTMYTENQYGNLYYPGNAGTSIFSQPTIIVYLGILGFGIGYVVGMVKQRIISK